MLPRATENAVVGPHLAAISPPRATIFQNTA